VTSFNASNRVTRVNRGLKITNNSETIRDGDLMSIDQLLEFGVWLSTEILFCASVTTIEGKLNSFNYSRMVTERQEVSTGL
jgi:hypothetical protein